MPRPALDMDPTFARLHASFPPGDLPRTLLGRAADFPGYASKDYEPEERLLVDRLLGVKWPDVSLETVAEISNAGVLSYLSDEALRYYLPALLSRALTPKLVDDGWPQFVAFVLERLAELPAETRDRLYNRVQLDAIRHCIRRLRNRLPFDFRNVRPEQFFSS